MSSDTSPGEDLASRQRRERRELQARIQGLKKSSANADKRRKRETTDLIAKLESELSLRHASEAGEAPQVVQLVEAVPQVAEPTEAAPRVSKAEKRRLRKAADELERRCRIAEQEEANRAGPRVQEAEAIKAKLCQLGLGLVQVQADGDCLYAAIGHQLRQRGRQELQVAELRAKAAQHLRRNQAELRPFATDPQTGEGLSEAEFEAYCASVEASKAWGSQLELRALAEALQCRIEVVQAEGPTTIQGEANEGAPLVITFHRHLYGLGEHYNSTGAVQLPNEQQ